MLRKRGLQVTQFRATFLGGTPISRPGAAAPAGPPGKRPTASACLTRAHELSRVLFESFRTRIARKI
jgi:hypothetical protein